MAGDASTLDQSRRDALPDGPALPGVALVFARGASCLETVPIDGLLTVGRSSENRLVLDDARVSRHHAEVRFDGARWTVRDLGSRNRTFVDGHPVVGIHKAHDHAAVAIGNTLLLLCNDIRLLRARGVELRDGIVIGPRTRVAWQAIGDAAKSSTVLHITGETGSGKEVAARLFHEATERARRPFVAVNCAAIPPAIAERLLFGARKGAYSGADANTDGYLTIADGGTLFLDEIAELSLDVQAKLLRAIETREVLPLGAAKPHKVDIAVCSATHVDLRAHIAAGRFREDLFFRLGSPSVALAPLRERREEIPWIIEATVKRVKPAATAHASLVEAALVRHWPGNVRELIAAVTHAAHACDDKLIQARHLEKSAGARIAPAAPAMTEELSQPDVRPPLDPPPGPRRRRRRAPQALSRVAVVEALRRENGNVSGAARILGAHRTQLRRLIASYQIDLDELEPIDER
jgi:DNA-binding NtrC family response regulator